MNTAPSTEIGRRLEFADNSNDCLTTFDRALPCLEPQPERRTPALR